MTQRAKNVNYFLMDGLSTGRIKCTMLNWTGIAYKIPRVDIDRCKDREDLSQSGVYFLFGADESDNDVVYVGQQGYEKLERACLNAYKNIYKTQTKTTGRKPSFLQHLTILLGQQRSVIWKIVFV